MNFPLQCKTLVSVSSSIWRPFVIRHCYHRVLLFADIFWKVSFPVKGESIGHFEAQR